MVDHRREEVVGDRPLGRLALRGPDRRAVARQVADQEGEAARGEAAPVPVEEVEPEVAEQIGFESLGVFFGERVEAQSSPRPSPVSLP
ncbi:hypothetical protein GA0115252_15925 [Streptomyces sp. DfronAA-171]|nr:hypothetical protein GA0115252_15925 [Streptomyces sp. DfronAA-171]